MKTIISSFLLLTVLLLSVSIQAQQLDQTFSGIETIDISTSSSDCIVKKSSGDQVNVKLHHTFGEDYKPAVEKSGSRLIISEKDQKKSHSGKATWTLTIPDNLKVSYNTGSGNFEVSDLDIRLSLNAGSGDFSLENVKGDVSSNAGSGDLKVSNFSGELAANVGSGDLEIDNVTGKVGLNSGSGDIELSQVNASIKANVGSGDITADQVNLAGHSKFNSGSGDVSVGLASSPKHNLTVNSGSGDSELDFNGNDINATVVMTANKKHGSISAPFAFDKEEEIDQNGHIILKKTAKVGTGAVDIKIGTGSGDAMISE